jgi:hypothetical protein
MCGPSLGRKRPRIGQHEDNGRVIVSHVHNLSCTAQISRGISAPTREMTEL